MVSKYQIALGKLDIHEDIYKIIATPLKTSVAEYMWEKSESHFRNICKVYYHYSAEASIIGYDCGVVSSNSIS